MTKILKYQVPRLWELVNEDKTDISRLPIIEIKREDIGYNKKERRIVLLDDALLTDNNMSPLWYYLYFDYDFPEIDDISFPEWPIPFIKMIGIFRTLPAFADNPKATVEGTIYTQWIKVENGYKLRYDINASAEYIAQELSYDPYVPEIKEDLPVYATVELVILNQIVGHTVQQKKG